MAHIQTYCVTANMKAIKDKEAAHSRLLEARELLMSKGLIHSDTDLAKATGKYLQDISDALRGVERKITMGLLTRIADAFPDIINRDYLLHGEGDIQLPDPDTRPHIDTVTVAAGRGTPILQSIQELQLDRHPYIPFVHRDYDFTIEVKGDSMEPELHEGDIVACYRISPADIRPDTIYVFDTAQGPFIKQANINRRKQRYELLSLNEDYDPIYITQDEIYNIFRVVAVIRTY